MVRTPQLGDFYGHEMPMGEMEDASGQVGSQQLEWKPLLARLEGVRVPLGATIPMVFAVPGMDDHTT